MQQLNCAHNCYTVYLWSPFADEDDYMHNEANSEDRSVFESRLCHLLGLELQQVT